MISVVNGEPLPEPDRQWEHHGGMGNLLPLLLVVVFVASGVLRAMFGRLFGSIATGGLAGGIAWLLSHRAARRSRVPASLGFLFAMLLGSTRGWSPGGGGWGGGFGGGLGGGLGGGFGGGRRRAVQRRRRRIRRRRRLGELVMQLGRLIRHVAATHWRTRMLFPASTLDAIEQAIGRVEKAHTGEIRFAIETALDALAYRARGDAAHPRARGVRHLRVWDTDHNNGVLIYVQLADHTVEIVADRGFASRVSQPEWDAVCRLMEEHFRAGRFKAGSIAGVEALGALLARHFPSAAASEPGSQHNELPDRPTLL